MKNKNKEATITKTSFSRHSEEDLLTGLIGFILVSSIAGLSTLRQC